MDAAWRSHLEARGARPGAGAVADFGDPDAERAATQTGTVLADLSHFGLIRVEGEDAEAFLHGQITSDLQQLPPQRAQYSGYCTAKGRLLATFLIWRDRAGNLLLMLPGEVAEAVRKRLSMFVLRSRARLADAGADTLLLGVAGTGARQVLAHLGMASPVEPLDVTSGDLGQVVALPGQRFLLAVDPGQAPRVWDAAAELARPVGAGCWDWLDIKAGVPFVRAATNEAFVPQMVNLEAIGGVSFRKGCYPGQEIVARTQYLGKLKRRMFLANVAAEQTPQAGDEVYAADSGEHIAGTVVAAEASPDGGFDLLAVIQASSVEAGPVRLKAPDGPALRFMPLPYAA